MPDQTANTGALLARHAEASVRTALTDTRVVAIVGPRQSGKTTLAHSIAEKDGRPFISLDNQQYRRFAQSDPTGFMQGLEAAVIDEIQRAPDLILTLKQAVDEDPRPGRYLITGSVDLFRSSVSPDSLAGRVETIPLLPLSQAEIAGTGPPGIIDRAFAREISATMDIGPTPDLTDRMVAGGYPEALLRADPARRGAWFRSYVNTLTERDVPDIAPVAKLDEMRQLIRHAALSAGQLLNMTSLGSRLGVDGKTVGRWLSLLEDMFLVRKLRAWRHSGLKRLVKAPKMQFLDSGLLAALRRVDAVTLQRHRMELGPLLECFVHGELAKAAALTNDDTTIHHYRDKDGAEVDLVLERPGDGIVGIEVKAGATAHPRDFRGLRRLHEAAGDGFACGIVVHDGERVVQAGPRLFAVPVAALWRC